MSSGDHYLQFDLTTVTAEAIIDEEGRPALLIRSGSDAVELSGGAHPEEGIAGTRRIAEAIWNYIMTVKTRQLNGESDPPPAPRTGPGNSGPGW